MTTIDDIGRRAGDAARADADTFDVEAGLNGLVSGTDLVPERAPRSNGRRWAAFGAVGAAAAAVVGLLVWTQGDDDPAGPMVPAPVPSTTLAPSTTPAPTTTTATTSPPVTTAVPTTTSIVPVQPALPPTTTTSPTTAPPPAAEGPVAELARAIGASRLITQTPGLVTSYVDGEVVTAALPGEVFVQASDGQLLWRSEVRDGDVIHSVAMTLEGTVVCDVVGSLHRIRAEDGGGYVASVEERPAGPPSEPGVPVPNFAVDCETGERTAIEPISFQAEFGGRGIVREGDRTFTAEYDVEGNADIVNEAGVSIDGEDGAGYHVFDDGAGRVAYVVMGDGYVHASPTVRARDTTTGEELWTAELDTLAGRLWWVGDVVLAETRPEDEGDVENPTSLTVIDADTGEVLDTITTDLEIVAIG